jgi:hypothetical protein
MDIGRHLVLNMILNVKKRFKKHKVVICCDSESWRKKVYPYYKFKRKEQKAAMDIDWKLIHAVIDQLHKDIVEWFPWMLIKVDGCEADDIIGTIVRYFDDLKEEMIIVSKDKDFQQLQAFGCKQYLYADRKFITCSDPVQFLKDQIMSGDSTDGVPNAISADNCLADGIRQTTLRKNKYDEYRALALDPSTVYHKYYHRNRMMIDLKCTPEDLKNAIAESFIRQYNSPKKSRVFDYMFKTNLNNLIEFAGDF